MTLLDDAVFVPAFIVTLLEMTEVVALVFALSGGAHGFRDTVAGAIAGVAAVAAVAVVAGSALDRLPSDLLLGPSAIVLAAFAVLLFRGTVRTYRRSRAQRQGVAGAFPAPHPAVSFGAGLSVGAVETTEAVIVLLALSAPGYGWTAVAGALSAGAILVVLALLLHGQIRKIKVSTLRGTATAMLLTYAIYWGGEALHIPWPWDDLTLIPIFVAAALAVTAAVWLLGRTSLPVETKS